MYAHASQLLRSLSALPTCPVLGRYARLLQVSEFASVTDAARAWIALHNCVYLIPFELQRVTGCRAAEVWNPQLWSEASCGLVALNACKGSGIRVFSDADSKLIRPLLTDMSNVAAMGYTYDNYRRLCRYAWRAVGVYMHDVKGNKIGSSHLLRHLYIKSLLADGNTEFNVRMYVGEKTEKAFNYYVNSRIFTKY